MDGSREGWQRYVADFDKAYEIGSAEEARHYEAYQRSLSFIEGAVSIRHPFAPIRRQDFTAPRGTKSYPTHSPSNHSPPTYPPAPSAKSTGLVATSRTESI